MPKLNAVSAVNLESLFRQREPYLTLIHPCGHKTSLALN